MTVDSSCSSLGGKRKLLESTRVKVFWYFLCYLIHDPAPQFPYQMETCKMWKVQSLRALSVSQLFASQLAGQYTVLPVLGFTTGLEVAANSEAVCPSGSLLPSDSPTPCRFCLWHFKKSQLCFTEQLLFGGFIILQAQIPMGQIQEKFV